MAELKARISLDASSFKRGLEAVHKQVQAVASGIVSAISTTAKIGAGIAAGIGVVGGALAAGVKGVLDYGSSLKELSDRTGAPIRDLAILQQAFKDNGLDAERVGPALNKMQKALSGVNDEGKPTADAMHSLGLNLDDLRKLSPQSQFAKIAKAIGSIKDPADRAALAMDVFGKTGGELNQIFSNPDAINHAGKVLGGQADILANNAEKFHKVAVAFDNIKTKLQGFFAGVASNIIDKLSALADILDKIDLSGFGERVGSAISSGINIIVNAFKSGKLGELLGLTLKAGIATAGDYLLGSIHFALGVLADGFKLIFSEDTFLALVTGFAGVALKIQAFLIDAFQSVIAFLSAGISTGIQKSMELLPNFLKKHLGLEGFKATSFEQNYKEQKEEYQPAFLKGLNGLADQSLKASGEALGRLSDKVVESVQKNASQFKPSDLFNSAGIRDQLESLAKSLDVPIEGLKKAISAVATPATKAALKAPEKTLQTHGRNIEADQFAKIGLFARASSTHVIDHARRTAENTTRMVNLLQRIAAKPEPKILAVAG